MEVSGGAEEGFVREWAPCSHILNLIPPRIQTGIFSNELCLTCVDAVSEYIALGTNVGLVYWYDRKKGNIQRLRCEVRLSLSSVCQGRGFPTQINYFALGSHQYLIQLLDTDNILIILLFIT